MVKLFISALLCTGLLLLLSLSGRTQSVISTPEKEKEIVIATLSITEPAYVDMPIWVSIKFPGGASPEAANMRYPYSTEPTFTWGQSFEVTHNGVLLPQRKTQVMTPDGAFCGLYGCSFAPQSAPTGRLPLHVFYRFATPGTYNVRYVQHTRPGMWPHPPPLLLTSEWVTLQVKPMAVEQRRQWQQEQVAHPPTDAGLLVGDYLPSLLASPDATVLPAFLAAEQNVDGMVSGYAWNALDYFDDALWQGMFLDELRQHGLSDRLVGLLGRQRKLTDSAINQLLATLLPSLTVVDPIPAERALRAFSFLRGQVKPPTTRQIDAAALAAVPHLLILDSKTRCTLADYLGGVTSDRSREVLWQLCGDHDAYYHAHLSLCKIGDTRDLRRLGEEILKSNDTSLPPALHRAYHAAALPYLQNGRQFAVSQHVRDVCEFELK